LGENKPEVKIELDGTRGSGESKPEAKTESKELRKMASMFDVINKVKRKYEEHKMKRRESRMDLTRE
jgi:hypothetical protein